MAVSVWKGISPWVRLYSSTPRLQAVPGRGRYSLPGVRGQGKNIRYICYHKSRICLKVVYHISDCSTRYDPTDLWPTHSGGE